MSKLVRFYSFRNKKSDNKFNVENLTKEEAEIVMQLLKTKIILRKAQLEDSIPTKLLDQANQVIDEIECCFKIK
jgi:hypothetical protein